MANLTATAVLLIGPMLGYAAAPPISIPTDIAVTLNATPKTIPGSSESFQLTVTATNLGPQPVDTVVLESSPFTNEFDFAHATIACTGFVVSVADGINGPVQFMNWYVAAVPLGTAPFLVGETRTCELTLALSPAAPAALSFTFALAHEFVDVNASNNAATVFLRGPSVPVVPFLSPTVSLLLALLLVAFASLTRIFEGRRRRPRKPTSILAAKRYKQIGA